MVLQLVSPPSDYTLLVEDMKISLKEAAAKLLSADTLVLTAHVNPDGDALGSCLGLYQVLTKLGKQVEVLIDDDISADYSFLPDIEAIKKPEQECYKVDLLVVLDASLDRVGTVVEKCQAVVLNIDHHITNDARAEYLYLDAERAATAEIVYQLLSELGVVPDQAVAACLYTGIVTDSGYFRYSSTKPETMRAAADLLATGLRPEFISEALEKRSFKHVQDKAKAMQTIEVSADGKMAGLFIDLALYETLDSTEDFIDGVRIIDGVDVAVLMKEVEAGVCRVSMRSKATDVSKIAASLGGGGHVRAAGCTIKEPLVQAKAKLLAAIAAAM